MFTIGLVLGIAVYVFAEPLVGIFDNDPAVLEYAKYRLLIIGLPYFLCGFMDIGSGFLRSIGYSLRALIITFLGSCVFRIVWVFTVFEKYHDVRILYLAFPISWFMTAATLFIVFFFCYKREKKMLMNELK